MRSLCTWILALTLAPAIMLAQAQSFVSAGDNNRLALVIGNSSYRDAPLTNPVNDANAMARSLEAVGFKVILLTNATRNSMRQGMRQFTDQIQAGRGVALFYYAGHGIQINGRNYLLPVGSDVQREYEVEDEAIDAGSVLNLMSAAKSRVNIVILDACRNNPFTRSFRSAINGLAPMQAPAGTVLAYATAPGEVASDGSGDNGLYTQHLLKNLSIPGLRIEDVFKNVRAGVRQDSGGKQIPWENTSLEGDFYFKAGTATPGAQASGLTAEQVQQVVATALAGRDQQESARRQAQQLEIERAVQAALQNREQEAATAQASNQTQQVQAAQAAVAKLKQELAELRVANQAPQPSPPAVPTDASEQQPATAEPQRLALASPTSRPAPRFTVGQPVARPDVAVGDRWRYQVTDLYTDLKHLVDVEVQSVTASRIYTHSSVINAEIGIASGSASKKIQVWDRDWNLLRDGDTEYSAPQPGVAFPLSVGKNWESTNSFPHNGGTWREDKSGRITGWEKVTVPAGTFDTVKVEVRGYVNLVNPSVPENGNGPVTETIYYSPAVGRIIKIKLERDIKGARGPLRESTQERWELVELRVTNQPPGVPSPTSSAGTSQQQPTAAEPLRLASAAPTSRPAPTFTVGQPVDRPDIAVGNRWRYQVTDLYTNIKHVVDVEVRSVTANRIYTQTTPVSMGIADSGTSSASLQVWDRDWNLLRDGDTEYSAPQPGVAFPLSVGKNWEVTNSFPHNFGTWREEKSGRITGWEKVTVPAGTFDTVKVEVRGYVHLENPSYDSGNGTVTKIIYYSPAVGRIIKIELERDISSTRGPLRESTQERRELVEFSR